MNWVKEYYRRIECGDIVTSKRVRAVYSRLVAEMDALTTTRHIISTRKRASVLFCLSKHFASSPRAP